MSYTYDPEDKALLKINAKRLIARDIDQLLGICEFALQDGTIDQVEAFAILDWLRSHRLSLDSWPANVLYERLSQMLGDGVLDIDEQRDLLDIVMAIARPRTSTGIVVPTGLPINEPQPAIVFEAHSFCFTGVFNFGKRDDCQGAIIERGGEVAKAITKKLHYLVIGNIGSEVWKHSSFGLKIAKAVEYRDAGAPVAIVSEQHWAASLK